MQAQRPAVADMYALAICKLCRVMHIGPDSNPAATIPPGKTEQHIDMTFVSFTIHGVEHTFPALTQEPWEKIIISVQDRVIYK